MKAIGVGIVGTGFGRAVHVPAFLSLPGVVVIGVASSRPDQAREVAAEFSLPRAFASWREMVECPEIQAISIAAPPALHAEISSAACAGGKGVLCEKPMALDLDQAAAMLRAARLAGVAHFTGFEFRELPALRFARTIVQAGDLGRLRHVHVTWIVDHWGDPRRNWSWRSDRVQGGGSLGALGVHVFDYVEWLLAPIKSLAARLAIRIPERPDSSGAMRPVTSEDTCDLLLELEDGTPLSLVISNVANSGRGHWIELYGERRSLVIGSPHLGDYARGFRVWEGTHGSSKAREVPIPERFGLAGEFPDGRIGLFVRLAERFVEAVREKRLDGRPSFVDGLRAQVILDAALKADERRRWIDVQAGPGEGERE